MTEGNCRCVLCEGDRILAADLGTVLATIVKHAEQVKIAKGISGLQIELASYLAALEAGSADQGMLEQTLVGPVGSV